MITTKKIRCTVQELFIPKMSRTVLGKKINATNMGGQRARKNIHPNIYPFLPVKRRSRGNVTGHRAQLQGRDQDQVKKVQTQFSAILSTAYTCSKIFIASLIYIKTFFLEACSCGFQHDFSTTQTCHFLVDRVHAAQSALDLCSMLIFSSFNSVWEKSPSRK